MRDRPASSVSSPPPSRTKIGLAWGAVFGWIALVWWLGSGDFAAPTTSRYLEPILRWLLPELSIPDRLALLAAIRKLAHPTVYGVLAALAFLASRVSRITPPWRAAALALGLAVAVASLDEARQSQVASRTGAVSDVGLDAAGAAITVAVALILARRRSCTHREGA